MFNISISTRNDLINLCEAVTVDGAKSMADKGLVSRDILGALVDLKTWAFNQEIIISEYNDGNNTREEWLTVDFKAFKADSSFSVAPLLSFITATNYHATQVTPFPLAKCEEVTGKILGEFFSQKNIYDWSKEAERKVKAQALFN